MISANACSVLWSDQKMLIKGNNHKHRHEKTAGQGNPEKIVKARVIDENSP